MCNQKETIYDVKKVMVQYTKALMKYVCCGKIKFLLLWYPCNGFSDFLLLSDASWPVNLHE